MSPAAIRISGSSAGEAAGKNHNVASGSLGNHVSKRLVKHGIGDLGTRFVDVGVGATLGVDDLKIGARLARNRNRLDLDVILAKCVSDPFAGLTCKNGDGGRLSAQLSNNLGDVDTLAARISPEPRDAIHLVNGKVWHLDGLVQGGVERDGVDAGHSRSSVCGVGMGA